MKGYPLEFSCGSENSTDEESTRQSRCDARNSTEEKGTRQPTENFGSQSIFLQILHQMIPKGIYFGFALLADLNINLFEMADVQCF